MSDLTRAAALRLGLAAPLALAARPARAQVQSGPVRIGVGLDDAFMQPYYAADLGYFKDAGLDTQIMTIGPVAGVPAAVGGSIDIGMADPLIVALAAERNVIVKYFAGGPLSTTPNPTLVLCSAKNSAIRNAKDLEGKTVGIISVRSFMQITTAEWLKDNGADPDKVQFVELHFPEMTPALQRGQVAAALVGEPFLTENKDSLQPLGVPFQTCAPRFAIFGWFARPDWLAANADLAHRLSSVLYRVANWVNTHRTESAGIESKYTKVPLDVVQRMQRNEIATSLRPSDFQPVLDMSYRYKVLARPLQATDLIATGFP